MTGDGNLIEPLLELKSSSLQPKKETKKKLNRTTFGIEIQQDKYSDLISIKT